MGGERGGCREAIKQQSRVEVGGGQIQSLILAKIQRYKFSKSFNLQ